MEPMSSEAQLAWRLAGAAVICYDGDDRTVVYTELGAGETFSVIGRILAIAVRKRCPLPAELVGALTRWLDGYTGHEGEPAIRRLLARVDRQT